MGRPLTGSIKQAGPGMWRASVPVRKGARKRIERSFGSEAAARRWVASQIDLLAAGHDADRDIGSTPTPTTSVRTSDERPKITDPTSLSQYAEAWHWERYVRLHS